MSQLLCYWCEKPFGTWYETNETDKEGNKIKRMNKSPCRKLVNNKKEVVYMHEICYIAYIKGISERKE